VSRRYELDRHARCEVRHRVLRTVALLLTIASLGCGGRAPCEEDDEDAVSSASAPILNGAADSRAFGVVAVLDRILGNACSGVVVSDRAVLTARHCIAPIGSESTVDCATTTFGQPSDPAHVFVRIGSIEHAVARVLVEEAAGYCGHDLALLMLTEPLSDVAPIALRLERRVAAGETFSAIGLGDGTRTRRDGLQVQCVGDGCDSALLDRREWWGDGAVCDGDSGGPALDGEGRVVGIASRKRAGCTATIYEDVAESSFVASALGIEEPPSQTDGASCSASRTRAGFAPFLLVLAACATLRRFSSLRR